MALKDTYKHLRDLLSQITHDLEKADGGNKAASQRVRTGTVKLEKLAKLYRKESIKAEKATKGQKKPSKKAAAKPKAKAAVPAKAAAKVKAKPKAKAHKALARPRALSFRKPTAKLPHKRAHAR
jgi:Histone H1-like protein Hc1